MLAVISIVALIAAYLAIQFALVWFRNRKGHKFFQLKARNLPILPDPKPFSGHLLDVIMFPKNWLRIKELHDQLGPSFGLYLAGQPWVATKDLDLIKLIEVDDAHKHIDRAHFGLPFDEFDHSIFQANGDDWRRIRRAITPALSNHKVRSDEVSGDIMSIVDRLAVSLELKLQKQTAATADGKRSIVIDVMDTTQRFALSVIFLITYKQDNVVDFNVEQDYWSELIDSGARKISNPLVHASIMFPFLRPLCTLIAPLHPTGATKTKIIEYVTYATDINRVAREQHEKTQKKLSEVTGAKVKSFSTVRESGTFKRRLVDTIIDAFVDKKITYNDFVGSLMFLLLAGFETTADTIACFVWHLAREQEIQEKLRKTIQEEGIDADYVSWCISETIRWHPAVNLGVGRVISEDINVNGILYPKGSFIMPSIYSIHHDEKIWPNHEKFDPERWRDTSKFHPAAFMGFGLGPRNCVGGKLAVHEIKLVIQMLLTKYRIEKCPETCDKYDFTSPGLLYTIPDQPIKVKLVELPKKENGFN